MTIPQRRETVLRHHSKRLNANAKAAKLPAQSSPKRINRPAFLRALAELGTASRTDIAAITGLSTATVSRVADELLTANLLRVSGTINSSPLGRRSELLTLNPGGGRVIGVHLGGHSNDVGLANLAGEVYASIHLPLIGDQGIDEVLAALAEAVDSLLAADDHREPLLGIGVTTGGLIDNASGRLIAHGQFAWRDIPLREWFERRFERYVAIGNAFQGLAWYESLFSKIGHGNSLLFVNCSTIIGAGFSTPNNIAASTAISAGQLGHSRAASGGDIPCTCGKTGCLQVVASDRALCREAERQFGKTAGADEGWTIQRLGQLAHDGNPDAIAIFERRACAMAAPIALLLNTLAPSVLVLGHNRHAYAETEHALIVRLTRQEMYPPLIDRIEMRPVAAPEPLRAVASPMAVILRDFYSAALDLVPGPRDALVPVLRRSSN